MRELPKMSNGVNPATQCIACRSALAAPYAFKNGNRLFRCAGCGTIFVHSIPLDAGRVYDKKYFCGGGTCGGYTDYDNDKKVMAPSFLKAVEGIEKVLGSAGRLLDVGAATGYFMQLAQGRGWKASGIEISSYAVSQAVAKGLNVQQGSITTIPLSQESFDAITLWDVFEHVPDPAETLDAVWRILKPGGVLALTTPDASSLWARLAGTWWHLLNPPEHLACYSRSGLCSMLKRHGFMVKEISVAEKRFVLSYVFHITANRFRWRWLRWLQRTVDRSPFRRVSFPLNFRDNMFILAIKA